MSKPDDRKTRLQRSRERIKGHLKHQQERWAQFVCWVVYGHSHKPMTMSVTRCRYCDKELLGPGP